MKAITRSVFAVMLALTVCRGIVNAKVVVNDGIYLDAEIRPRLEFDNCDFYTDTGYDSYGTVKTLIGVGLDFFLPLKIGRVRAPIYQLSCI